MFEVTKCCGTLLLAAFLLSGTYASAQKEITFGSSDQHSGRSHFHHKSYDGKNSLSVGLVSWISGYTPLYYERALVGPITLQVGLGVTSRSFTTDLSTSVGEEGGNSDFFTYSRGQDITDNYSDYKYRKTVPGLYLSFAPKIYYTEDVMDGSYISPMIELKQYHWNARMADVNAPISSSYDDYASVPRSTSVQAESMRCLDFTVNFGGHYQTANHVVFGWSTGIGVRNAHSSRLDIGWLDDGTGTGNYRYANAEQEYDKTKLLLTFQFVVGGWF